MTRPRAWLPRLALGALLAALPLAALAQDFAAYPDAGEPPPPPPPPAPRVPARSINDAMQDPRFVRLALQEDMRVKITRVLPGYPYYGIPNNGCSAGQNYLEAELLTASDGLAPGTSIVLRIEDATIGPATQGATLAFSGLRRAGKGPNGTWVYCGRGTAFQIRQQ